MLLSMTGYGRATITMEDKTITAEIKSLNSKYSDIRFNKLPQNYKEKELELRKIISEKAQRGKLDLTLDIQSLSGEDGFALNRPLFERYCKELISISQSLDLPTGDMMQAVIRLPNVVSAASTSVEASEWKAVQQVVEEALGKFHQFRLTEGAAMEEDCQLRVNNILQLLQEVPPFEAQRIEKLRSRLSNLMDEYVGKDNIDANRFEQEVLYYMEKIDITEEKVRLEQHCQYFLEELAKKVELKGRKLSFISQEMGREINTLGSKANSSDIQRLVVRMKDELEKIKEQVANSL
ncbi:MAG: YicC/YloC family endoribonuclease [Bacteroidota bacterium]